jgi:hypothetical protein
MTCSRHVPRAILKAWTKTSAYSCYFCWRTRTRQIQVKLVRSVVFTAVTMNHLLDRGAEKFIYTLKECTAFIYVAQGACDKQAARNVSMCLLFVYLAVPESYSTVACWFQKHWSWWEVKFQTVNFFSSFVLIRNKLYYLGILFYKFISFFSNTGHCIWIMNTQRNLVRDIHALHYIYTSNILDLFSRKLKHLPHNLNLGC